MARKPKFEARKTPRGWQVNVPAGVSATGKRERCYFESRDKARDFASKLREAVAEHGNQSSTIRPALAEEAVKAHEILKPWGKSLLEAAHFLADTMRKQSASLPIEAVADAWLVSCEELRSSTQNSYRYTVERLKASLSGMSLASINAQQIESALRTKGATSYAMHRRNAQALWRWAAQPERGWCDDAIFAQVARPRRKNDGEISVLSPQEVRLLLATAEKYYPETVAIYAIALFAGVRADELQRLQEEHVKEDGIEMSAYITKKHRRRHVPMNKTLGAWLDAYPFQQCTNWRQKDKAVRRLAGWQVVAPLASKLLPEHTLPDDARPWPQNVLRHTHASAAVAAGCALEDLLFSFGHSGGPDLLRRHYVGRYPKKDAIEFWTIGPNGTKLPAMFAA